MLPAAAFSALGSVAGAAKATPTSANSKSDGFFDSSGWTISTGNSAPEKDNSTLIYLAAGLVVLWIFRKKFS
jgi:hypothetical protein